MVSKKNVSMRCAFPFHPCFIICFLNLGKQQNINWKNNKAQLTLLSFFLLLWWDDVQQTQKTDLLHLAEPSFKFFGSRTSKTLSQSLENGILLVFTGYDDKWKFKLGFVPALHKRATGNKEPIISLYHSIFNLLTSSSEYSSYLRLFSFNCLRSSSVSVSNPAAWNWTTFLKMDNKIKPI
jgi:hypothetical protein